MITLYAFKKPNIYLYEPWAKVPEEPLCSFVSDDIEKAIKEAEVLTGLSFGKGQMTVSYPMMFLGLDKGSLSNTAWNLYFRSLLLYSKFYHLYLTFFWKNRGRQTS